MSQTTAIPNPPDLAPNFEIRRLEQKHIPWASAIVMHSNVFCSPVWANIYPNDKTPRLYAAAKDAEYLISHQINSGMSFGVFDRDYKYKNPASASTQGKLYWDQEANPDASQEELLRQMDFPLVSVALSYDGINPLDPTALGPLVAHLPLFAAVYQFCHDNDHRDPSVYTPTAAKQALMRNGTSTRQDYEGMKIMGTLARWLMREAKKEGYRSINIEAAHDAVAHVWLHPPSPFKGELICTLDPQVYEEEGDDGELFKPFAATQQAMRKIFVML